MHSLQPPPALPKWSLCLGASASPPKQGITALLQKPVLTPGVILVMTFDYTCPHTVAFGRANHSVERLADLLKLTQPTRVMRGI